MPARGAGLADAFVFASVVWMYAPAFGADYLVQDDFMFVGREPTSRWLDPAWSAAFLGFQSGRWLGGLLLPLAFLFASDDPARIRLVRLAAVGLLALAAVVTRRLLDRSLRDTVATALLALAIFSQRAIGAIAGYSFTMFWTAVTLPVALAAFAIALPSGSPVGSISWRRLAAAFACVFAGLQVNQAVALFGLVPLVAAVLADWPRSRRSTTALLGAMVLAFALEVVVYAAGLRSLHAAATTGYDKGEAAMSLATSPIGALRHALDPRVYWPAFRLWAFPYPLERVRLLGGRTLSLAYGLMLAWGALVASAAIREQRRLRTGRLAFGARWAAVLVGIALAAFPILAESPRRIPNPWFRSHVLAVPTGVVLVMGAWALREIARGWSPSAKRVGAAAAAALVAFWCAGARSGLRRGMVAPGARQFAFVRSELSDCRPAFRIRVLLPERNGCVVEPCDNIQGSLAPDSFHASQVGFYRFARALACGEPESPPTVEFLHPASTGAEVPTTEGTVIVDWNEFVRRESRRRGVAWRALAPQPPP